MAFSVTMTSTFCNHLCNSADGICGRFHISAAQSGFRLRSHSRQVPQPYAGCTSVYPLIGRSRLPPGRLLCSSGANVGPRCEHEFRHRASASERISARAVPAHEFVVSNVSPRECAPVPVPPPSMVTAGIPRLMG